MEPSMTDSLLDARHSAAADPSAALVGLVELLIAIVGRAPRPDEEPHRRLVALLNGAVGDPPDPRSIETVDRGWRTLVAELLCSAVDIAAFFPAHVADVPELPGLVRGLAGPPTSPESMATLAEARRGWIADQARVDDPESLMATLLAELATADFSSGGFALLSRYYRFKDALYRHLVDPGWAPLQRRIADLLALQQANWGDSYVDGYAYQGSGRLGISGVKPTEIRLAGWAVDDILVPGARVLDIGSNCGFLSLEIARTVARVEAIEYNPYLVLVAHAAQDSLGVENVNFACGDFTDHAFRPGFDVVLSFANHQTIDRHMTMPFIDYVAKIHALLRPGGTLLFESHNVFGPGTGGPGDDGDLDAKFDIAERFFDIVRHKMTRSFVPGGLDVDKLFVVLRRRDEIDPRAVRTFDLAIARRSFDYDDPR
jgi:2-polyprenyl-3-methyl-5-hydroxy-6-metoxy-1,4-benzoquinol methylase